MKNHRYKGTANLLPIATMILTDNDAILPLFIENYKNMVNIV
jgi:hypothetical protein